MGGRLRQLRRDRDLSLRFVARRCQISFAYLSEIEREQRPPLRPSHPAYQAMAELYGVDPGDLRRTATEQRQTLAEGVSWRRRKV